MTLSPRLKSTRSFAAVALATLALAAAGLVLSAGTAAPASAGTPCWRTLINDWFDGKIDHVYPRGCYTQAIAHLPNDVQTYSNAADEIRQAMLAALGKHRGGGNGGNNSGTGGPTASANTRTPASVSPPAASDPQKKGLITRAIEWLGPSDAGAVPLPLLILAGVAFLLLALAGGSLVNRRLQERRLPPPPRV
jgi:hypothetical protein